MRTRGNLEVTVNDTEIVSALRTHLAEKVGPDRFGMWFAATRMEYHQGRLSIAVQNRFYCEFLKNGFQNELRQACAETLGHWPEIEFSIDPALAAPANLSSAKQSVSHSQKIGSKRPSHLFAGVKDQGQKIEDGSEKTEERLASEASSTGSVPLQPSSAATFLPSRKRPRFANLETFIVGPSNRVARASAAMVAERPGQITPLLLHGPTSVGKTHLLEGILTAARRRHLGSAAVYLTAEQFTTQYVEAVRGNHLSSFREKYRSVKLLLIDDIQFFLGKQSTLVELLYTIDSLIRDQRQVVLAADRPLDELTGLGAELVSRLRSGMIAGIEQPEHATRLGIVGQIADQMEFSVPADVQNYIASRLTSHARELSGALCRLQAVSEAFGRSVNLGMAEESLSDLIRHSSRVVRLPDIEHAVCRIFGLEPESLQSNRRAKRVSQPRMLAMWLARKHTRSALAEIGDFFGHRSHSTVVSAQKRIDSLLADSTPIELADQISTFDDAIRQVEQLLLAG